MWVLCACSIAGAFDPATLLKDDARPPIRHKLDESKVTYVASVDGQRTVVQRELFATRAPSERAGPRGDAGDTQPAGPHLPHSQCQQVASSGERGR